MEPTHCACNLIWASCCNLWVPGELGDPAHQPSEGRGQGQSLQAAGSTPWPGAWLALRLCMMTTAAGGRNVSAASRACKEPKDCVYTAGSG